MGVAKKSAGGAIWQRYATVKVPLFEVISTYVISGYACDYHEDPEDEFWLKSYILYLI